MMRTFTILTCHTNQKIVPGHNDDDDDDDDDGVSRRNDV